MSSSGIIPAGAGLTIAQLRVRHDMVGSSPRVRGSRMDALIMDLGDGIIPAGAGLTVTATRRVFTAWDHPRGCGAHSEYGKKLEEGWGSSPRVRGSLFI